MDKVNGHSQHHNGDTKDEPEQHSYFSTSNCPKQEALLLEPYSHIVRQSGKNIRQKLIHGFNQWMNVSRDKIAAIEEIINMLHNASLLIDDIEDSSKLRRGQPCAHLIYGQPSTINTANYVYFIGLEKVLELGHPQAVSVYTQQMLELHRGQGMEIYWRDNFICPTEQEYKQMIDRKTGGLFNLAVRLMQLFSSSSEDFAHLTSMLGLYFQIRDDFANLKLESYAANKSFAEDLTEGKYSFPMIHCIRVNTRDDRVSKILRQRTEDVEVKRFCISLLEEAGSFDYTRSVMRDLDREICEEISRLGGNPVISRVMQELRDWE